MAAIANRARQELHQPGMQRMMLELMLRHTVEYLPTPVPKMVPGCTMYIEKLFQNRRVLKSMFEISISGHEILSFSPFFIIQNKNDPFT